MLASRGGGPLHVVLLQGAKRASFRGEERMPPPPHRPHRVHVKDRAGVSHSVEVNADVDTVRWFLDQVADAEIGADESLPSSQATRSRILCEGVELAGLDLTLAGALPNRDWSRPTTMHVVDYFLAAGLRGRRPGYMEDRHAAFAESELDDPFVVRGRLARLPHFLALTRLSLGGFSLQVWSL